MTDEKQKTQRELADEAAFMMQGRQFRARWAYDGALSYAKEGQTEKAKERFQDASWELVSAINHYHKLKKHQPETDEGILGELERELVEVCTAGDLEDPYSWDYWTAIDNMGANSYLRVMNALGKTPKKGKMDYLERWALKNNP
jgi:hypothetical protein